MNVNIYKTVISTALHIKQTMVSDTSEKRENMQLVEMF